jgi:hypothetical protein
VTFYGPPTREITDAWAKRAMDLPTLAEIDAELAGRQTAGDLIAQVKIDTDAWAHQVEQVRLKALADDPADLPALTRLAERLAPALRRLFLQAVEATRAEIDAEALAIALQSGQHGQIEVLAQLDALATRLDGSATILRQGFLEGAGLAYATLNAAGIRPRFDLVNPHAVTWAAARGAELVVAVTEGTREAIRDLMRASVAGGRDIRATARAIRAVVGLDPRRARAVEAFRTRLEADGVAAEPVTVRTDRYAAAQLRDRATVITRTETLTAEHRGQEALWTVARQQGLLDPGTTRRTWIVTDDDRLDAECEALDGAEAELDGDFPGGVSGPPLHPQCRCSEGLVFKGESPT